MGERETAPSRAGEEELDGVGEQKGFLQRQLQIEIQIMTILRVTPFPL